MRRFGPTGWPAPNWLPRMDERIFRSSLFVHSSGGSTTLCGAENMGLSFRARGIVAMVVAAGALTGQSAGAQEAPAAVDASLYVTVLAHLGHTSADRVPVVIDSTMTIPANAPLLTSVPEEMRASFLTVNQQSHSLPRGAFPPDRFRLLPRHALADLPHGDPVGYWSAFRERYPGLNGIVIVSAVGRSPDGTRAVVYVTRGCGGLCGSGHLVTLRKQGDAWTVEEAKRLWVA